MIQWQQRKEAEMKPKEYMAILQVVSEVMGGAMHIVNADGITILYNEEMAKLEKLNAADVLGKPFRSTFSYIPEEESTLYRALHKNKATMNKEQTYLNAYGKEITTINSTVPIVVDERVIAAIEVARDITELKTMSETIMDLRSETGEDEVKRTNKGIKKYGFDDLIGENAEFKKLIAKAKKAANNDATVFIYGETGTGKELFAQSIHYDGIRGKGPFLAQNCAALPESLLEGILFGTTKGGFTGAVDRAGLFEQANGGTLFLDEISAMPYDLQSKLLRVLQEEYIRRVGGNKEIPVDVRIIAAVNEPVERLIETKALRKDLYFRLNIINLTLPALKERKDDIPILANAFLKKHNARYGKEVWMISDKALQKLENYDYPGNVRELENIIMSAVSMAGDEHVLSEQDISVESGYGGDPGHINRFVYSGGRLADYLADIEKTAIRQHLTTNGGECVKDGRGTGDAKAKPSA
jgi:arginine utilization regulatory protein